MALKRHVQDSGGVEKDASNTESEGSGGRSRTAGTNRDFDAQSDNQGHGHPRGERHGEQVVGDGADTGEKGGLPGGDRGMGKAADAEE
jgi:hypothetical protein